MWFTSAHVPLAAFISASTPLCFFCSVTPRHDDITVLSAFFIFCWLVPWFSASVTHNQLTAPFLTAVLWDCFVTRALSIFTFVIQCSPPVSFVTVLYTCFINLPLLLLVFVSIFLSPIYFLSVPISHPIPLLLRSHD